jgi:hypothetical protein
MRVETTTMARSRDARIARLEASRGDPAAASRIYRTLKACYEILSRLDDEPMPDAQELWAWAMAEARSGRADDFTAALEAIWAEERQL